MRCIFGGPPCSGCLLLLAAVRIISLFTSSPFLQPLRLRASGGATRTRRSGQGRCTAGSPTQTRTATDRPRRGMSLMWMQLHWRRLCVSWLRWCGSGERRRARAGGRRATMRDQSCSTGDERCSVCERVLERVCGASSDCIDSIACKARAAAWEQRSERQP